MSRSTAFDGKIRRRASRGTKNPFISQDRENFPNLDPFLHPSPSDDSSTFEPNIEPSPSFPSTDGGGSNILNISIGARAALAEHMRHIARHGVDGEGPSPHNAPTSILDLQWERYLAGDHAGDVSRDTAFSTLRSPHIEIAASTPTCFEQSIEVMTDISHDFFNSSRVEALMTPDRNRSKMNFLSTRQEMHDDSDDEDDIFGRDQTTEAFAPEMFGMQPSPSSPDHQHQHTNFQSASFFAPDISRISSADDSEHQNLQRSPAASFSLFQDPCEFGEAAEADPGHLGEMSAINLTHVPLEDSFASTAPRKFETLPPFLLPSSPHGSTDQSKKSPATTFGNPSRVPQIRPGRSQTHPTSFRWQDYDECNTSNISHGTSQSFPLSFPRRSKATNNGKGVSTSFPSNHSALETITRDFLSTIDDEKDNGEAISPISQVGSQIGYYHESSSSVSSRRRRYHSARTFRHSHQHYRLAGNAGQESSSSSTPPTSAEVSRENSTSTGIGGSASSSSLTGRKRFRTVVPRRVYMDSPSEFPDEQDSFGHYPDEGSSDKTHRTHDETQRSLLDSFEATIEKQTQKSTSSASCSACYMYT